MTPLLRAARRLGRLWLCSRKRPTVEKVTLKQLEDVSVAPQLVIRACFNCVRKNGHRSKPGRARVRSLIGVFMRPFGYIFADAKRLHEAQRWPRPMPAFITFHDLDPWFHKPCNNVRWLDHNKIGYLDRYGYVTYPFLRGVKRVEIEVISSGGYRWVSLEGVPYIDSVEKYFTSNLHSSASFSDGVDAVVYGDRAFFDHPFNMPDLDSTARGNFSLLEEAARPGDLVFTRDLDSLLSRVIAGVDHGSWSHVATYIGNGQLYEAVTTDVSKRSLSIYKNKRYRVGLYRVTGAPAQIEKMISFIGSQLGKRYNYKGAA